MFVCKRKVRFADVDFAGIVFYPRYFEMLNGVVEDWFEHLGFGFEHLLKDHQLGALLVAVETDFKAACYLNDALTFKLTVAQLGERSVTFDVKATTADELKIVSRTSVVCAHRHMSGSAH